MASTLFATGVVRKEKWQAVSVFDEPTHGHGTVHQEDSPWERTFDVVAGFRNLGDDWDGQGASGFSDDLLKSAIGLACVLRDNGMHAPVRAVPGPEGTVIFEWQEPDGTYCAVEVVQPFHAEVMLIEPGQPAQHWTLPSDE